MHFVRYLIVLFVIINTLLAKPTLFKDVMDYCTYTPVGNTTKNESVQFFSNDWLIEENDFKISFKFCGDNNDCPKGSLACLYKSNKITIQRLGNMFVLENGILYSKYGDFCTQFKNYSLMVHFTCNLIKDKPILTSVSSDGCEYHVQMTEPKCKSQCSTVIRDKLVSMEALAGTYTVKSETRNFSITLCDKDPVCNLPDINACEFKGVMKTPISSASELKLFYDGDHNEIVFKSNTKRVNDVNISKIDKRFELTLKCDWDKDVIKPTDIKYIEKQTEGQKYDFELETSFGCIKNSVPCVLSDSNLIYNISGLYTEHKNTWSTKSSNGSLYFLQICGPAEFSGTNTSCRSTHAQVCENFEDNDINRGAILRHLEVHNDVLTATIENGKRCNKMDYYSSSVNFVCNSEEEGPRFIEQNGCRTFFQWKTPHACPRMNPATCAHIKRESHKCTFYHRTGMYDLTALADVQHSINMHNDQELLINLCGSVNDRDAPCFKDATIALKSFNETNIKHKLVSLGKFHVDTVHDEDLILKYTTGALCEKNYVDYTSEIRFKCSQAEKDPVLLEERDCHYVFLWETRHACPKKHDDCSIEDKPNDKKLDLSKLAKLKLHVSTQASLYKFNLCESNYTSCSVDMKENCAIVFFNHSDVKIEPDIATLQWTLPELCKNDKSFNIMFFKFLCDNVIKDDRIASIEVANCTANIEYRTNLVCSKEAPAVAYDPHIDKNEQIFSKHVTPVKTLRPEQNLSDCSVKSPFTNVSFDLNRTVLNYIPRITHCPKIVFNDTYRYASVIYDSEDKCDTLPFTNILYETVFKCSKENSSILFNNSCYKSNNYLRPEYCQFFNSRRTFGSNHIGLIVGLCLGLLVIICLIVFIYLRKTRLEYKYIVEYKNVQD